jgi:catechol 2,3-dioxygenase-like lactoylglutathione lyase family enzyme
MRGWVKRVIFPFCFGCCGAGPEPEAVVAGLQDVAVVREPVEQGGGHLGIAEHASPFTEAEVGGDDDAGLLVELGEQVEQQGTA